MQSQKQTCCLIYFHVPLLGGVGVTIKASHVCLILILFTELQLNFVESRRAKSKTNMLLNLLSRSTPGGSRSDDQSTRCSLYPNPFHRTTACKKGTLSDFEEKWSDIPNLLFEAWEIIARTKQGQSRMVNNIPLKKMWAFWHCKLYKEHIEIV